MIKPSTRPVLFNKLRPCLKKLGTGPIKLVIRDKVETETLPLFESLSRSLVL